MALYVHSLYDYFVGKEIIVDDDSGCRFEVPQAEFKCLSRSPDVNGYLATRSRLKPKRCLATPTESAQPFPPLAPRPVRQMVTVATPQPIRLPPRLVVYDDAIRS